MCRRPSPPPPQTTPLACDRKQDYPWCSANYSRNRTDAISNSRFFDQTNSRRLNWPPMELHISLVGRKNLSSEIYRQIRRAIADRRLRPGDCLPACRDLARSLQVSRTTVTVAYDRLASEGFLTSRIGAGTYVSDHLTPARKESRSTQAKGALQPRPFWNSLQLSRAFAKPAEFDFRTG